MREIPDRGRFAAAAHADVNASVGWDGMKGGEALDRKTQQVLGLLTSQEHNGAIRTR